MVVRTKNSGLARKKQSTRFDSETHTYYINDRPVPSVTQIIDDLIPPFQVADWYLKRGRAVHACAALIARGIRYEYDDRIKGQVVAIERFMHDVNPTIYEIECPLYSDVYGFAGTPDLICNIKGKDVIVDYKASYDPERAAIQLAGYFTLLEDRKDSQRLPKIGHIVTIRESGSYSLSEPIRLQYHKFQFLSLLNTYKLRDKMGYHGNYVDAF